MQKIHRGLTTTVSVPFHEAVAAVRQALQAEGFGVLTEVDVQKTLKEKLGVDTERHLILGACNPPLAHRALQLDIDMSLLLPCNVTVREEEGRVVVSIMDPLLMADLSPAAGLKDVAIEARTRLERVIQALASR